MTDSVKKNTHTHTGNIILVVIFWQWRFYLYEKKQLVYARNLSLLISIIDYYFYSTPLANGSIKCIHDNDDNQGSCHMIHNMAYKLTLFVYSAVLLIKMYLCLSWMLQPILNVRLCLHNKSELERLAFHRCLMCIIMWQESLTPDCHEHTQDNLPVL